MSRLQKSLYQQQSPDKQYKIWLDSPCSLSFANKLPYIERAGRFQHNSIYDRDDPFKPAKKIDEFQKPELLLTQFRRSVKQAQKRRGKNNKSIIIRNQYDMNENQTQANTKQKQIVDRLCPKNPRHLKLEYDLYGNRSSFFATDNQKTIKKTKKNIFNYRKSDNLFTQSGRIDMSRPQNFNPGPGTYFSVDINSSSNFRNSLLMKSQLKTIQNTNSQFSHISRHSQFKNRASRLSQIKDRPVLLSKTIVN